MGWLNHQLVLFGQRDVGGHLFFVQGNKVKESRNDGLVQEEICQKKYMLLFSNLFGQLGNNITRISGFEEECVFFSVGSTCFLWFFQGDMKPHKSWRFLLAKDVLKKWILGRPFIPWLKSAGGGTS